MERIFNAIPFTLSQSYGIGYEFYEFFTAGVELVHKLLGAFDDEHQRVGVFAVSSVGDSADSVFGVVDELVHFIDW